MSLVAEAPVAVLLPGSASSGDYVTRTFGPALRLVGIELLSTDPPAGDPVAGCREFLDSCWLRYPVLLVGGVSLGAHVAVSWAAGQPPAARHRLAGLLLALPAWTGPPGPVAAASTGTAHRVRRDGIASTLAGIAAAAPAPAGWVADELAAAWPRYTRDELAATLAATATIPGPDAAELAALDVPAGIATFRDDPLHPRQVAHEWAALLPRARVVELGLAAGADRAALGRAAVLGWLAARAAQGSNR